MVKWLLGIGATIRRDSVSSVCILFNRPGVAGDVLQTFVIGPQQNQGKGFYREAGFTEWSCVWTLPPDQEEAPAWQRQYGPGA